MAYDHFNVRSVIAVSALALAIVLIFGRAAASEERVPGAFVAQAEEVPNDVFLYYTFDVWQRVHFQLRPRHRAIAIGPAGYAGTSYRSHSKPAAIQKAIANCERRLRKSRHKSIRNRKCYAYAIDDAILLEDKMPSLPFGTARPGNDIPLEKALYDKPPKTALRGILLVLHGCDRVRALPKWIKRWFWFFRTKGLRVIVPDSFAEKRPPSQCVRIKKGKAQLLRLRNYATVDRLARVRTAQTHRTIRTLKQRFPGIPLIIWGHSEGGAVAQLLDAEVAAILTSGVECGIQGAKATLVRADVPLLTLIGESDPYIRSPKKRTYKNVRQLCNRILDAEKWNFAYVKGMGHRPSINNPAVKKIMHEFIEDSLNASGK